MGEASTLPDEFDNPLCIIGEAARDGRLSEFTAAGCEELHSAICKISPCSTCDTCVERWYTRYTSLDADETDFEACCVELGYPALACEEAAFTIATSVSEGGTVFLEERPAAICNLLGDCDTSDSCHIRDPSSTLSEDGSSYWIPEEIDYWLVRKYHQCFVPT
ncbi:hypothetical protein DUNSADRAFT_15310 [Dunaliella salina]|uniref:Uncharacterized protein n=1 Tax=Dunaliella salina TaxID=3046 RepID=A0ABQ7G5Q1_DUNSA|nr:hypothetical protein DUNSADRAFT_15310 [Dunaliella salina]|eukprot:KAF5829930.1 hypothetical protein DUNSADRAFT_15310 [Dunaliella salina]